MSPIIKMLSYSNEQIKPLIKVNVMILKMVKVMKKMGKRMMNSFIILLETCLGKAILYGADSIHALWLFYSY